MPEGTPTWMSTPKAHKVTGPGTQWHSQVPLLIDFLRLLHTCKNGSGLASVPEPGWELRSKAPSHPVSPVPCEASEKTWGLSNQSLWAT